MAALRRARPWPLPSTIAGYRTLLKSQLLPTFGEKPIESITTPEIEAWIGGVDRSPATRTKALVLMHGIFKRAKKVYGLPVNPVAEVEKPATTSTAAPYAAATTPRSNEPTSASSVSTTSATPSAPA